MPVLKFTLSEEGVNALRDVLACLSKFGDEVCLEARRDSLVLTALNLSKSAYASFSLSVTRFFSRYHFEGVPQNREKFFCKLYNKSLLSLFRPRSGDPLHDREKDTVIDRCEVAIVDEPGKKSRFIARIIFRNGITTKYRLPFEVSPPVHARFDKQQAKNHWTISSRTLRSLMDHFGPGIEYLDIHAEDDEVVNLTCFTEKVVNGDQVLKKPLHTSIAVEQGEFEEFDVAEDKLHIVINVKDFRAIIQHAGILGTNITASYSMPAAPMQLKYEGPEIRCEFLLMTVGERGAPGQKAKKTRSNTKAAPNPQLDASAPASRAASRAPTAAPTPRPTAPVPEPTPQHDPMPALRPAVTRPEQRPPPATLQSESLFVPQDNDYQWDPVNPGEEEEEEDAPLGWAGSGHPNPSMNMRSMIAQQNSHSGAQSQDESQAQFEPTQRLSDVRKFGLFGD